MIRLLKIIRETLKVPYTMACDVVKLAYSTFMRWKGRMERREPLVKRPGPKPVGPLDLGMLERAVKKLPHRNKRTHGTGALYARVSEGISRRDFQEMVKCARDDANAERSERMWHIVWKVPNLAWAIDDTEYGKDLYGEKLWLHSTSDLATRYRFPPLAGDFACGEEVAGNLVHLFEKYDPPLFAKRDNAGNLNHCAVQEVLSAYGVIPLNSPPYCPSYNGAIEKSQDEVKVVIEDKLQSIPDCPREHFGAYAEAAVNDWNHKPRRSLKNQTSCHLFFSKKGEKKFSKRERRDIFEWIKDYTYAIIDALEDESKRAVQAARRIAVETWLQINGFIEVSIGRKVLPSFSADIYHK